MLAYMLTFYRGDRDMANSGAVHLTEQNFDETLSREAGLMMVDFWAEWCGPCKAIAPILEDLTLEAGGRVTLAKVNVDENPGLAARYGIRSIPTIPFVKQGKVADQVIGAVPKAKLREKLDALASDAPGGDRISTSGFGTPPLSPTRDEVRALAGQGDLVPVFAELPADVDAPLSAYLRLRAGLYAFLLESVEGGEVWARCSFLGTDPLMVLTAKNGRLTLKRGARTERLPDGDPLPAVRELLGQFQPVPVPGLPRFQGGAVGYLAYDMVHHMERLPR